MKVFFLQLPRKLEDQVSFDASHRLKTAFPTYETKMVMYIITSKLNSIFGTISQATDVKMTAKPSAKTQNFSVKNNLNMWSWSEAPHFWKILNNFLLLLNRFLRIRLNENLLLLNFLVHFFRISFISSPVFGNLTF